MSATAQTLSVQQLPARTQPIRPGRKTWINDKKGNALGANFTVPENDFARFLGYKKPTQQETSGKKQVSGPRTLEIALQKEFSELGKKAMVNGMAYRNMYVSHGRYANKPGQSENIVREGLDSINASVEMNGASNMRYLEMQYKFQMASKSFGTISNLMKVRHESTKKTINEVK